MDFHEAMRWVEASHAFPEPMHFHARRLAWILDRTGLYARAGALPWAVVAGSCGKASTARFLAHIARALLDRADVRGPVALATKPPLSETLDGQRERYQLLAPGDPAPRWIPADEFARHASALRPVAEALAREAPALGPIAPYDLRYAIMLLHALEHRAAFAVLEANIGLLHDPTSALPPPRVQLLTPIDTDHAQLLRPPSPLPPKLSGLDGREGPVWHKAGGFWEDVPAVIGLQDVGVASAVAALAWERGASPVLWRGADFDVGPHRCGIDGSDATLRVGVDAVEVHLRALGGFQVDNAAQAAAAASTLQRAGVLPGDRDAWREAVREGLGAAAMPGRMELVAHAPLTLLQVGASAVKMRGFVDALGELLPRGGRVVACASFLARIHDAQAPVAILARAPWLSALVVTACAREGDAADLDPEAVAAIARRARPELAVHAEPSCEAAVATARALALSQGAALALVGNGIGEKLSGDPDGMGLRGR